MQVVKRENVQLIIIVFAALSFILAELVIYFVAGQVNLILSNLFYLPVIILAFRYPRRGVMIGVILGVGYLILVSYITFPRIAELIPSVMQFYVFVIISIIISSVSSNIRLSEAKYEGVFKNSRSAICLIERKKHKIVEMNPEFRRLLEIPENEDQISVDEFLGDRECRDRVFLDPPDSEVAEPVECRMTKRGGDSMIVLLNATRLAYNDLILVNLTDITESENALIMSENRYRTLVETAQEGIWVVDKEGLTTYVNPKMAEMLMADAHEMIGQAFSDYLDDRDASIAAIDMKTGKTAASDIELDFIRKDGSRLQASLTISPLNDMYDKPAGNLALVSDISEQKRYEKQLEDSLEEKSVLIKEIHHRVKNNLQIISGLIRLQSRYIKNEQAVDALRLCQTRVSTMALVHESLYQSGSPASINARSHITKLATMLIESHELDHKISIKVDVEEIPLNMNTAVPASLIINELVLNAIKHAFPGKERGTIRIALNRPEEGRLRMEIEDDGIGLPEDLDIGTITSLGLKLVVRLVRDQLKGTLTIERKPGTRFIIVFPYISSGNGIPGVSDHA